MPIQSLKQEQLQDVDSLLELLINEDHSDLEDEIDLLIAYRFDLEHSKYFFNRTPYHKKEQFDETAFYDQPISEFRSFVRMTQDSFRAILRIIENDPVFHNYSYNPQAPVWIQLAVALDRFGHHGNGASIVRSKILWNIGFGTILLYFSRIKTALLKIKKHHVCWPTSAERRQCSITLAEEGFRNCVGFIDGTLFPIFQKPGHQGEVYFDRKKNYSINAQIVCDHRKVIFYLSCGWPGSTHDARAFRNTLLMSPPPGAFDHGQYLIADSAYPTLPHIVTPYKGEPARLPENIKFNTYVAQSRIRNEHCIGLLKGRFYILRGLRVMLNKKTDVNNALDVIESCVVLHNILTKLQDPWDELVEEDGQRIVNERRVCNIAGEQLRERVKQDCLDFFEAR